MRKDVREFIRRLEAAGLTVESTPGHYRVLRDGKPLRKANGIPFMLPFSPDTVRWRRAAIVELRKLGIDLQPGPPHLPAAPLGGRPFRERSQCPPVLSQPQAKQDPAGAVADGRRSAELHGRQAPLLGDVGRAPVHETTDAAGPRRGWSVRRRNGKGSVCRPKT
jgi:hypothetical protein